MSRVYSEASLFGGPQKPRDRTPEDARAAHAEAVADAARKAQGLPPRVAPPESLTNQALDVKALFEGGTGPGESYEARARQGMAYEGNLGIPGTPEYEQRSRELMRYRAAAGKTAQDLADEAVGVLNERTAPPEVQAKAAEFVGHLLGRRLNWQQSKPGRFQFDVSAPMNEAAVRAELAKAVKANPQRALNWWAAQGVKVEPEREAVQVPLPKAAWKELGSHLDEATGERVYHYADPESGATREFRIPEEAKRTTLVMGDRLLDVTRDAKGNLQPPVERYIKPQETEYRLETHKGTDDQGNPVTRTYWIPTKPGGKAELAIETPLPDDEYHAVRKDDKTGKPVAALVRIRNGSIVSYSEPFGPGVIPKEWGKAEEPEKRLSMVKTTTKDADGNEVDVVIPTLVWEEDGKLKVLQGPPVGRGGSLAGALGGEGETPVPKAEAPKPIIPEPPGGPVTDGEMDEAIRIIEESGEVPVEPDRYAQRVVGIVEGLRGKKGKR